MENTGAMMSANQNTSSTDKPPTMLRIDQVSKLIPNTIQFVNANTAAAANNSKSIKLPSFWTTNLDIWFSQLESTYDIKGVTNMSFEPLTTFQCVK